MPACDYLIIGGGVVGLSAARELKLRRPAAKITLIEKEETPGEHASGRNSGVLPSGSTARSTCSTPCRPRSRAA